MLIRLSQFYHVQNLICVVTVLLQENLFMSPMEFICPKFLIQSHYHRILKPNYLRIKKSLVIVELLVLLMPCII